MDSSKKVKSGQSMRRDESIEGSEKENKEGTYLCAAAPAALFTGEL